MDDTYTSTGMLLDLPAHRCWELAGSQPVGRLAWNTPTGPTVIPVNFTVDGRTVRIRTAAYSAMARECDDSPVTFEVDHVDREHRVGWSVLLRGWAHLEYADAPAGERAPAVDVWAAGSRAMRVVVTVDEVSGRQIVSPT